MPELGAACCVLSKALSRASAGMRESRPPFFWDATPETMNPLRILALSSLIALTGCTKQDDSVLLNSKITGLELRVGELEEKAEVSKDMEAQLASANTTIAVLKSEVSGLRISQAEMIFAHKEEVEESRKDRSEEFQELKQTIVAFAQSRSSPPSTTSVDSSSQVSSAIEAETEAADRRAQQAENAAEMRAARARADADQDELSRRFLNSVNPSK